MHLDIRTIFFITAVIQALYAVGIFLVNLSWIKSLALRSISLALAVGSVGSFLIVYRGMIHPFLSIVVANVFVMASPVFALEAVISFRKIKTNLRLVGVIFIILVIPILSYATFISPSLSLRIIVMSSFFAIQTFICAHLLTKDIDEKLFMPARATASVFLFATVVLTLRVIWTIPQTAIPSLMGAGLGLGIFQLSHIFYITGITFGFIWLNTKELGLKLSTTLRDAGGDLHEHFDFIDVISHELKTPLATIQNSTESLFLRLKKLDSAQGKAFERINRSLKRLDNVIEIGLKQKRLNPLQIQNNLVPTAITELIQTAIEVCTTGFPEHRVRIHHDNSFAGEAVLADPNSLLTAFTNILENAMKFSNAENTIHIVLSLNAGMVTISIADTGCGLDDKLQGRVFEKYLRGKNVFQVPGDGVGLFIVEHIIKAHRGELTIQNRQSGGCRVNVSLPVLHDRKYRRKDN